MDNIREKVREQNNNRKRKILLGVIMLIIIVAIAVMIEKSISMNITDVTIKKSDISEEKASFIHVRQLGTDIITVKLSDGSYRLAFNNCKGCYMQYGKEAHFKNNNSNTGIICKNCKSEVAYEEFGYDSGDVVIPYPIYENEILVNEESFVLSADYLEQHKYIFEELGKGTRESSK